MYGFKEVCRMCQVRCWNEGYWISTVHLRGMYNLGRKQRQYHILEALSLTSSYTAGVD